MVGVPSIMGVSMSVLWFVAVFVTMVMTGIERRRSAPFTVHPTGITGDVVLFFPDRNAVLDLVDDISASREGFATVRGADAHPDGDLAEFKHPDAVHAAGAGDAKAPDGLFDYPLAFLDRE